MPPSSPYRRTARAGRFDGCRAASGRRASNVAHDGADGARCGQKAEFATPPEKKQRRGRAGAPLALPRSRLLNGLGRRAVSLRTSRPLEPPPGARWCRRRRFRRCRFRTSTARRRVSRRASFHRSVCRAVAVDWSSCSPDRNVGCCASFT
ncbi:hypothetical protein BLAT2472_20480 [Burkholderia latens]